MYHRRLLVPTLALAAFTLNAEEATNVPAPAPVPKPAVVPAPAPASTPASTSTSTASDQPATPLAVSATRLTSAPQDQPYAFYQHGRSELDHQTGRTAVEALNNTPGVFVQKTAGNQSSPYIRGLTGEQSLLLFDGVRLNNAMFRPGANQYSSLIPDSSVGSIDVILGSANTVVGSDGLTGAIDFRLAEAGRGVDGVISPWVSGRAGYADGYRVAGGIDGRISDFVYSLDGGYAYYHDLEGGKDAGDHLYGDAAGDETIPNSGFHEYHFGGRVAYVGLENNRFELSAGMTEQWDAPRADGYYENSGSVSTNVPPVPTRISRYYDPQTFTYVHARHVYGGEGAIPRIQTTLYWHQQHEEQGREDLTTANPAGTVNRYRFRGYEDTVDTLGLDLQLTSHIERHELTYGGTVYQDRTNNEFLGRTTPGTFANGTPGALDPANATAITNGATNPGQTTVPDDSTYMGVGIFLQDFWRITDQWDVLAGVRYSQYSWNADVTADRAGFAPGTGGIGNATLDETVDALTGSLRIGYSPVQPVYTFAGVSQGFRAPNLSNLAGIQDRGSSSSGGQGPQVNGNPDLEPEKSLTYELGGRFTEQRDTIALTGFYTTIEDLIQIEYTDFDNDNDIDGNDRARAVNAEEGRLWGAEFSFDYGLPTGNLLPDGARLAIFNVTNWVNGEVDAFNPATSQVEEFNISKANRLFGQAGVRLDLASGWWGLVRTRWSDVYDDPAPGDASDTRHTTFAAVGEDPGSMPGYAVLDAKVGWVMAGGKYWVDLTVENLLNTTYREPGSGIDGSGINAILSAGARF